MAALSGPGRSAEKAAGRFRIATPWSGTRRRSLPHEDISMREYMKFYIDGHWVDPVTPKSLDVINPADESVAGHISLGSAADVDKAVAAARKAFVTFSQTSREERIALLERIVVEYQKRYGDLAAAITEEMGAPASLAQNAQAAAGLAHLKNAINVLKSFQFDEDRGATRLIKEPIGVCGFITPWNWPVNQIAHKVGPALAVGCAMVLKPSEIAPFSGYIFSEILDAAGVPAGVYNMINGDGPTVGAAISAHPGIDMVSFTGSTRAGVEVARAAAATVKRVAQELGGKSPNIILEDADLETAVSGGVLAVMNNSGQSCNAPTRMLVPSKRMEAAIAIAKTAAESVTVGDPNGNARIGPVVSETQWNKIQRLIKAGIDEGATLVTGGLGRPEGLDKGYYVKPTIFANVNNEMQIAREEIFGPVVSILPYETVDQAIEIGNDTEYGLAAYVSGKDQAKVRQVAAKLRAGQVSLNGARGDMGAPFGGYKMSGNGREGGDYGFAEFLEVKAVIGYEPPAA
jgi:aldehyde dehydrogenase (NAD+)